MMKYLVYGTGKAATYLAENLKNGGADELIGFIQTNPDKETFFDRPVYSPDDLKTIEYDRILMVNRYMSAINELLRREIPKDKIKICHKEAYTWYVVHNNFIADIEYDREIAERYEVYKGHGKYKPEYIVTDYTYQCQKPGEIWDLRGQTDGFDGGLTYIYDFIRVGTFNMISQEIKNHNIPGDIAELGVYQGDFAKLLNVTFPDRRLHLFDTYGGFDDRDVNAEVEEGFTTEGWFENGNDFSDTSLELVKSKMRHIEMCKFYKGYFPDTAPEEEYRYAFISLDADLYQPMLAGLEYFYPRLNEGGYMMLHDYNYKDESTLNGVKQAVEDFEKVHGRLNKVPLIDLAGTLVVTK